VLGDWRQLVAAHHERAIEIDARTATTRWRGEGMDYGLAIDVLLQKKAREGVSAETRLG
jgi:hypothetical protein